MRSLYLARVLKAVFCLLTQQPRANRRVDMPDTKANPPRHVIIGAGAGVFEMHRPALQLETVDLIAVSDVDAKVSRARAQELGCAFFTDHDKMLAETHSDVAVVLVPPRFHAQIAIDCLEAGCHVLVEKPMAVHVAEADAMIEAAERADRLLAVSFQRRFRPEVRAARELIQQGQLGQVQRIAVTANWTRTSAYFEQRRWRGTWAGEGGGVLMNQSPHDLDLICHLMGMPVRVVGWTRTLLHQIEAEDTVEAMLEWPNGALGTFHASTAEASVRERVEIIGTAGYLTIAPEDLTFRKLETDLRQFVVQSGELYAAPEQQPVPVEPGRDSEGHVSIYRNLHAAILQGAALIADGIEGRMSLELANAIVYSSCTRNQVELPLDRQAYADLLERLKASQGIAGA